MLKDIRTITHSSELEIYEPNDVAKAPSYAKFFRMSDVLYFTKKLWKKVKGFKDKDEAEVIIAFATIRLRNLGIYTRPCGCAWCSFANWSHQDVNDYLKDYLPVFEAYSKWCMAQR